MPIPDDTNHLGPRGSADSPTVNLAPDNPVATRAYDWAGAIARAVGSASAATGAVGADGEYELSTDTDCYVKVGSNPTASATSGRYMAAGTSWTIQLGAADKVGVVRKSSDGNLYVLPVA